jgi:hypothetical protein
MIDDKVVYDSRLHLIRYADMPSADDVDSMYENDVYSQDWIDKELREVYGGFWNAYYDWKLDLLKEHHDGRRLSEIGSGIGSFTARAFTKALFSGEELPLAINVEPSPSATKYSLLRSVSWISELDDEWLDSAVHASLLFEHLRDPDVFLDELRPYAKTILVVVPNEFNPLQRAIGGDWFIHEHHLNYFTPSSLRSLLVNAGYTVVFTGATFPMELFMFLVDYRKHEWWGRFAHRIRLAFEKFAGSNAFRLYKFLFDKYGWGREIVMVATRND